MAEENTQEAFSLDNKTKGKVLKSAILVFLGYGIVGLLELASGIQIDDPDLKALLVGLCTWGINFIKEFISGVKN